jgi:rhamnosyl/mannosyltransferase
MVNKLYFPWIGGVEKIVQQISEGLNRKGKVEIDVLCCNKKRKTKTETVRGVKVIRSSSLGIFWGMPVSFSFFRAFKRIRNNYDVIDFHHPFPLGDLALFLFPPKKARVVLHYHSDIVRQKIFVSFLKPFILNTLKRADKILVSNPNLIKNSSFLRRFEKKCEVVPFGVDLERIKQLINEEKVNELKKRYGDFVLFIGRLSYYKGVDYLIEAMKDVDRNLVIIGKGEREELLKEKAKILNLENKIFFLSFQSEADLVNFYQACKVFVLPSIYKSEAFGIVLIEAMALGKPVISTELATGTSWVNINNQTGFVVPPKNKEALAEAINKVLENNDLYFKFSKNAEERVKENFTLEKMLLAVSKIYKELI